jgi:putative SbcD/Mre11-related phosphoesterase
MFLKNHPAMKIGNSLVIADLHIGITKDIYQKGVILPRQASSLANEINKLKKMTKTRRLIVLGDIKHRLYGLNSNETEEVRAFFSLLKYKDIIIIKGNHDGDIEKILTSLQGVKVKKFIIINNYYLTHGHRNVNTKRDIIVIGHNQPHIRLIDEMGAKYTEPVWVKGLIRTKSKAKKRLIIMPAFNKLCGATIVNKDELLGPIAKKLIKSKARVYLLDGTDIGTIKDLMIKER